jgi:hypothetical protein
MERYSLEGKNAADTYPALLAVVYGSTPTPPVSNEGDGILSTPQKDHENAATTVTDQYFDQKGTISSPPFFPIR